MGWGARLDIGDTVAGRYCVEARLGQGNMGAVFRARHLVTGRPCALKVIQPNLLEDPELIQMFVREAQVLGRLGASPHIADVLDAGFDSERDVPFLVMDLLEGEPLDAYIEAHGPLDPALALALLEQLAEALDHAHEAGVVHRDLKPANLFLTRGRRGEPVLKVVDFGIAKVLEQGGANRTATQVGSPLYAAPEQLGPVMRQMAAKQGITISVGVSAATDVWAFGLVALELIAGVDVETYWTDSGTLTLNDMLLRMALGEFPLPSLRAGPRAQFLPAGFDGWLMRCLRKDAAERWRSAGEAVRGLGALLAPAAGHASPPAVSPSPAPPSPGSDDAPRGRGALRPVKPRAGRITLGALAGSTATLVLVLVALPPLRRAPGAPTPGSDARTEEASPEQPSAPEQRPLPEKPPAPEQPSAPVPAAPEPPTAPAAATPATSAAARGAGAAAPIHGRLSLSSIPASNVVLDGRPLGGTPRIGVAVAPGKHTVMFVHPEHGRKTITVTVRAGETKTAAVRFTGASFVPRRL